MILGDRDLKYYLEKKWILVDPLTEDSVRENGIDMRVGGEIARFKNVDRPFEEGMNPDDFFVRERGNEFVIWPNEHVLMVTEEYLRLPQDIMAFVNMRSSFARLGLLVPPTIVDAGFEGQLTIEVMGSGFPVKIRRGTRFLHLIFAKTLTPVENPYKGKYQGQRGVTIPKFTK
ncbi:MULTISPECIES: dCTP deaminase [Metallosphaera]|uniref:dCTP deaminase n=4 Tax=Metallosphaera TaxID=41980 RepID=DCD_METS5|nr:MULTISPECIES: dCTP deaminase [Metallosphaera]A4YD26.1 RecName: Full=dCTP deaminase; AltName: Full=Deoxycytidine triphosphate deaminase [Metallosphaera sedula DSM 5348]ABP94328.1 dCTP deaminase [Metallosphaera sedula DSM 5348]AIM26315.1 dCTP deaminase [Metallosphaera sedula]AKV73327.1 deoxycytidine triphosphate deaminase [Metallosphaera sedula]AKV75571.1 deoxycytidine triphosphate deaminase [Metallosphaera sedula]AKV77817.1 deoxycytidine triphosphate deaminase [Metallosphaera sedula]